MKLPKEVKDIMKYFKKNDNFKGKEMARKSYVQASSSGNNIRGVLKIKKPFPNLQSNKIKNIQKIINRGDKPKSHLNMTIKGSLCKQVIVPMDSDNIVKFMFSSNDYIININRLLKNIKSEYKADYIRAEKSDIIIIIDKVISPLDLQTIEKYIENSNQINANKVESPWLPQSKFYLKIISLLYFMDNMNVLIKTNIVKKILKNNHIFNNIHLFPNLELSKYSPSQTWLSYGLISRALKVV